MLKEFQGHVPQLHPSVYTSETSLLIGCVHLAADVSVWPGCVLRADIDEILVGEGSNIQDAVLIHTNHGLPVIIGKDVTVGHGAILHGCRVGDNCLVGMGATILDGADIGENCLIGAGALVTEQEHIPSGSLVLGVPGRVVRTLTHEEIRKIAASAAEYRELARRYRKSGQQNI